MYSRALSTRSVAALISNLDLAASVYSLKQSTTSDLLFKKPTPTYRLWLLMKRAKYLKLDHSIGNGSQILVWILKSSEVARVDTVFEEEKRAMFALCQVWNHSTGTEQFQN